MAYPRREPPDRRRRDLDPQGRPVGGVARVALGSVEAIELPQGKLEPHGRERQAGRGATAPPSSATRSSRRAPRLTPVKHETEEFAYVVSGSGELRLDGEAVEDSGPKTTHCPYRRYLARRREHRRRGRRDGVRLPAPRLPADASAVDDRSGRGRTCASRWRGRAGILALEGYADLTLGHVSARGDDGELARLDQASRRRARRGRARRRDPARPRGPGGVRAAGHARRGGAAHGGVSRPPRRRTPSCTGIRRTRPRSGRPRRRSS